MAKRTFNVPVGKEVYLIAIMERCEWVEVDRVATGGQMSEPTVMITFEGEKPLQPMLYVQVPAGTNGYYHFYTYWMTNGYFGDHPEKALCQYRPEVESMCPEVMLMTRETFKRNTHKDLVLPDYAIQYEQEILAAYEESMYEVNKDRQEQERDGYESNN